MQPVEQWATGREPMTARQAIALERVAAHDGIDVPFLDQQGQNGQNVTKAEAYKLIADILSGVRPTAEHLDALGRNDAHALLGPPHPSLWNNRNGSPTEKQIGWLKRLVSALDILANVRDQTLQSLTSGQASALIDILRARSQFGPVEDKRVFFEAAVQQARTEVPL
ncbi:hypothetical protein C8Q79DRAFT_924637 [Trametes meyenii]|nr:hypothetical protein C8Q79DRAFT_924637 [Trametes meyenii]